MNHVSHARTSNDPKTMTATIHMFWLIQLLLIGRQAYVGTTRTLGFDTVDKV